MRLAAGPNVGSIPARRKVSYQANLSIHGPSSALSSSVRSVKGLTAAARKTASTSVLVYFSAVWWGRRGG
eukprot:scaffold13772_cov96-Isochrysis_galbana.AAC.1